MQEEQAKGLASDSFKRAGFNCGIGRELYSSPFIWINAKEGETRNTGKLDKFGKPIFALSFGVKFRVNKIVCDSSKHIIYLELLDNNNNVRFAHGVEPSLKWYVNEELKNLSESKRLEYIEKIKSKKLEVNQELLDTLKGII